MLYFQNRVERNNKTINNVVFSEQGWEKQAGDLADLFLLVAGSSVRFASASWMGKICTRTEWDEVSKVLEKKSFQALKRDAKIKDTYRRMDRLNNYITSTL